MTKTIVLVERLNRVNLPILRLLSFFGVDVRYIYFPRYGAFANYSTETLKTKLQGYGFRKIDFATLTGSDPLAFTKLPYKMAQEIIQGPFEKVDMPAISDLFSGLSQCERKIKNLYYYYLIQKIMPNAELICTAQDLEKSEGGKKVRLFFSANFVQRRTLGGPSAELVNLLPVPIILANETVRFLYKVGNVVARKVRARIGDIKKPAGSNLNGEAVSKQVDNKVTPVILFPHKGVNYANLSFKDFYYDEQPLSPFSPQNITHVEFVEHLPQASIDYYVKEKIPHFILDSGLGNSFQFNRKNLYALIEIWKSLGKVESLRDRLFLFSGLFRCYLLFWRASERVGFLKDSKLALIGYDYLFPIPYVLALQSHGLKVAAMQARFELEFHDHYHPVFDEFFVSGQYVKESMEAKAYQCLDHVSIIGLVRAEDIRRYRAEVFPLDLNKFEERQKLIMVLDFAPVNNDSRYEAQNALLTWETHHSFYRDILVLADKYKDAHFVIRGKNANWLENPYFSDIVGDIEARRNIEVSTKFDEMEFSYKILSQSDLVIGRQGSVGDEGIAAGIPMIIHDWTLVRSRNFADVCDYGGYPVYTHSLEELSERVGRFMDGKGAMDEALFNKMRMDLFNSSEPSPKNRMMLRLKKLVEVPELCEDSRPN